MSAGGPSTGPVRPRPGRGLRLLGVAAAAFLLWLVALWPPPAWYRSHFPRETSFMAMRRRQGDDPARRKYQPVPLARIPRSMQQAVLVSEDHRFFVHGGVDYQEVRKALGYRRDEFLWSSARDRSDLWRALSHAWGRRDRVRGASTITQQLAKNLYLSPSRNPLRKVKELVTAWRLESALGKDRILELYLNVVELGPGVWGVEAASQKYFGRSAARLSDPQAALLAATLPGPLRANPGYRPGRIRWRQDLILRRMRGEGIVVPPPDDEEQPEAPSAPPAVSDTLPQPASAPPDTLPRHP